MRPLGPRSLAGRTVLVLVAGLILTHIATVVVFSEHRAEALTNADEQHIARHVASITEIMRSLPDQWRDRVVRSTDDHAFRVYLTPGGPDSGVKIENQQVVALSNLLSRQGSDRGEMPFSVSVLESKPTDAGSAFEKLTGWLREQLGFLLLGHGPDQTVLISVPLSEKQRLNFSTDMPLADTPGWTRAVGMTVFFLAAVLLLSWWAVRRLSAPLAAFANAATTFAQNVNAPAMPETGPSEVRAAARAFNDMQMKVRQLVENRSRMLAAISHDLRTPLTALRLRAESVAEEALRTKMLVAVGDMEAMLSSTLAFARAGVEQEEICFADVGSMVEAICEDMSDAGHDVTYAIEGKITALCQPVALKRALTNLIDNAIKYGLMAGICVSSDGQNLRILIDDQGPGIPEKEMERVFLPFYRLEASRSRNTGGAGLGMTIAQLIIDSHGGTIQIENRNSGGLRTIVTMPLLRPPGTRAPEYLDTRSAAQ